MSKVGAVHALTARSSRDMDASDLGRKLQIFAEQFGVRTARHGPGDMSPLGHAANIHIDLASRNFGVQEWSGTEPPNFVIQELKGPREALLDVFLGLPEFRKGLCLC